jgi:Mrp family chromosome partitioning ATPase
MNSAISIDQSGTEPTVFSAARRYWLMVVAITLLTMAGFVGYTRWTPPAYQASASVTVPQELSFKDQLQGQYIDRQMILLRSQEVALKALNIAHNELGDDVFEFSDFSDEYGSLDFKKPEESTPGAYGANTIGVVFRWHDARSAQAGVNAVLQAFDEARSASIRNNAEATIAAIDKAIEVGEAHSGNKDQRGDLMAQRAAMLVDQQIDLSQHPTFQWAVEPPEPINNNERDAAVLGLMIGAILGTALAYAFAIRRRSFDNRFTPAALYDAPLIGEIPAFRSHFAPAALYDTPLIGKIPALPRRRRAGRKSTAQHLLPVTSDSRSPVVEAFRFTAGSIERIRSAHGPQLSILFMAPRKGSGKSTVVANVALALAEGGRRVLAIDADATGDLTALLLPDAPVTDGFEQVLAGRKTLMDCAQTSTWNEQVTVLAAGQPITGRAVGAAYSMAVDRLLAESKPCFDIILIDGPALLSVADAAELVEAADVAVVIVRPHDLVRDHRTMAERLALSNAEIVGYVNERASVLPSRARIGRESPDTQLTSPSGAVVDHIPAVNNVQSVNGKGDLDSLPRAHR